MTVLLVYKQFRRKSKGRKLKSKWSLVAKVPLRKEFRNLKTFIIWIYLMLQNGTYRVQTRLSHKKGFTPLIKFETDLSLTLHPVERIKGDIRVWDDNWGLLKKI